MGCGGSRLGGVAAARDNESGVVPLPAGIRPLLRRRLEEMKKRSHASVLKGSQTLSKKELLQHGYSEDAEQTEENDGSLKWSAKVGPAPAHHVEEKICVKILTKGDVKEVVKKQEEEYHREEIVKKQEEENHHDDESINVNKEGDDDIKHDGDEGRMSKFDERMIGPGSPSFRVYCIHVASDDNEEKDGADTRKSTETESVMREQKEDESIVKKEKRDRRGKRFGIALPRKYLANVTAPCYAGGGCMGNTHSRLVQEKSNE